CCSVCSADAAGWGADCAFRCLSCTGASPLTTCMALPRGAVCAEATCAGAVMTPARTCNGAGICQQVTPISCSPYTCRTDAPLCGTVCMTPADCNDGWT